MARRMEMFGGVAMRRVIAATDMATGAAQSQMNPARTDFQALLAP
jgi:hypothetical protein